MIKLDHVAVLIAIAAIGILSAWPLSSGHGNGDDHGGHGNAAADHGHGDGHGATVHWSYAGADGPEHWGTLSPDFAACAAGRMQSPIDLTGAVNATPPALTFAYKPSPLTIVNNGHTIQVDYAPGSTLSVDGEAFELLQFHFHAPSEHSVDGARAPMEVHLVHKSAAGTLAVIGVLMDAGAANAVLAPVWEHMPHEPGRADVADATIDAAALLPPDTERYFRYKGSLTTPPCSEGVRWFVMTERISLVEASIAAFEDTAGPNARPIQALNERLLIGAP